MRGAKILVIFVCLVLAATILPTATAEKPDGTGVSTDQHVYQLGEPVEITFTVDVYCLVAMQNIRIVRAQGKEIVQEPNPYIMAGCILERTTATVVWGQTYSTYQSGGILGDAHNGQQVPPGAYYVEAGGHQAHFVILPN